MRLRRWYPLHRRQRARPRYFAARNASFRAMAPAVMVLHGLAFLRGGMIAAAPRAHDGIVAFAGVTGAIGGDAADFLISRDLAEKLG